MDNGINLSFEEKWEKSSLVIKPMMGYFILRLRLLKFIAVLLVNPENQKINVEFYEDIREVEAAGYRACKRCQPEIEYSPHTQLIKNVTAFIINEYKQSVTLQDMAEHVGISPFHLERLFKQETAETPRTYLEKIRIDKAAHLLKHTDYTNLEICYEAGFQSPSNFYKVFRRLKNCSLQNIETYHRKEP